MISTTEEMIRVIERAKALGVREFEFMGLRVKFRARPEPTDYMERVDLPPPPTAVTTEEVFKPQSPLDDLTPEEILLYATPSFDQLQAEKQAHKEKLAEERT